MDKDLGQDWRRKMARGAKYVVQCSHVKANDYHYDAKLLPHLEPVRSVHVELSNTSPNLVPRSPYLHQVKSSVLSLVRMCERMVWNGIGAVRVRERKSFCTFQEPLVFDSKRLPHISVVSFLEGGLAYQA